MFNNMFVKSMFFVTQHFFGFYFIFLQPFESIFYR